MEAGQVEWLDKLPTLLGRGLDSLDPKETLLLQARLVLWPEP